jgi:hypothetical protein
MLQNEIFLLENAGRVEVMVSNIRVLFILKYREVYDIGSGHVRSNRKLCSGLANSARFINDMLVQEGIQSRMVEVIDNNDIDREVYNYRPTHVIIEAFWVVPEKFEVLQALHPTVNWIIRSHSEIPFLAQEGPAMDWLIRYVNYRNVCVSSNSEAGARDFRNVIVSAYPEWPVEEIERKVILLPNFYPVRSLQEKRKKKVSDIIDIGCFGAVRPLKNQLIQAVAALEYARIMGKQLRFHINADRPEQGGQSCLANLRALFSSASNAELVEHSWMGHEKFLALLSEMDIGMQVTFTETFNIVSADMVVRRLPIVVSEEVIWAHHWCKAKCTDSEDIVEKLLRITDWRFSALTRYLNLQGLKGYSSLSKKIWLDYLS